MATIDLSHRVPLTTFPSFFVSFVPGAFQNKIDNVIEGVVSESPPEGGVSSLPRARYSGAGGGDGECILPSTRALTTSIIS